MSVPSDSLARGAVDEDTPVGERWLQMRQEEAGRPLQQVWRDGLPRPGPGQVRIRVSCCGVCRTDLHVVDGELAWPGHGLVPGHEIVGTVSALGPGVSGFKPGDRVGVPWLGWACGKCPACSRGQENLCPDAKFTGWQLEGGFAQYAVADTRYVFALPEGYDDQSAAPLLCAGLIGWRAYVMAGPRARRIGIYGFGAAAHLITQVAVHQRREIFAFTRPGDEAAQALAHKVGACWTGGSNEAPPEALDAALLFAPVGELVPIALKAVRPGGTVVCAGIHMSDIPSFAYELLWGERRVVSVANLTRADGVDFLRVAGRLKLQVSTVHYPLAQANRALDDLRAGRFTGAAVLNCA